MLIWGYGIVECGLYVVEYMLIGSYYIWYGLFFVKGVVGVIVFVIFFVWSLIEFVFLVVI